jgi:hypothetical protein
MLLRLDVPPGGPRRQCGPEAAELLAERARRTLAPMSVVPLPPAPGSSRSFSVDTYPDRLALLDLLSDAYPVPTGFLDPMEGDRIQTAWQLSSGRGALPWWNRVNYCLTVWRLQALQARGELPGITLQGTEQVRLPEDVAETLRAYYDALAAMKERTKEGEARLQRLFWVAHAATVQVATRAAVPLVDTLPKGERAFALGWGKVMVKVLADVNFSTDRDFIGKLNTDLLPQRVCTAADLDLLSRSDLPEAQRATAISIAALYEASDLSPVYTPVLEAGATVLDRSIETWLELDHATLALRKLLRGPPSP